MPRTPAKKVATRPALPLSQLNPHLSSIPKENYVVKYQTIVREDQEIVVGRVKVPTPKGHAFVLRRYDTGAFSQTTLFKACFPSASDEQERQECEWVKASGDNANANGGKASEAVRLAGTWVVPEVALRAAASYGVTDLIQALADAHPDPEQAYRKSQRSQAASETLQASQTSIAIGQPETTSAKSGPSPAPKRTRVAATSPPPPPYSAPAAPGLAEVVDALPEGTQVSVEVDVPKQTVDAAALATAARERAERELAESQALVAELKKAEELRKQALLEAAQAALDKEGVVVEEQEQQSSVAAKRSIDAVEADDDAEEATELEEGRQIATNARALRPPPASAGSSTLETVRQAAWGALVFGVGVGATTILPRFFF